MSGSLTGTQCVSDTESSLGGFQETFEVHGLNDRYRFGLTHQVDWSQLLAGALLQEDETGYRVRYTLASKLVNELVVGVRLRLRLWPLNDPPPRRARAPATASRA